MRYLGESDIETGDILFFQGDDPQSRFIRYYCESKWSHVGMAFKVRPAFIVQFKAFFDKHVHCPNNTRKLPTIGTFRNMVTNDCVFYAALLSELKMAKRVRDGGATYLDDRVIYLWESTENDQDPCQITNKTSVGVKLTNLGIRACGYANMVGVKRLTSGKRPNQERHGKHRTTLNANGRKEKLYDIDVYLGMIYGMYCNLNKDYEKTYWDLLMCWIYDFKYRYDCCHLSACPHLGYYFDAVFPMCCYYDYHYVGEYYRFFCAELICLTLIQVFQMATSIKQDHETNCIGYHECLENLTSGNGARIPYHDRTVVSIEYLLDVKTFATYKISGLKLYDKLYCT